jgi:dipeptidase E
VLSLFGQSPWDYQDPAMLLDMDLVYVGGGSTANLLSLWRRHGVDEIDERSRCRRHDPRRDQRRCELLVRRLFDGFVRSAGPLSDGLGFLRGSACPHFHGEPGREESFLGWIARMGACPPRGSPSMTMPRSSTWTAWPPR